MAFVPRAVITSSPTRYREDIRGGLGSRSRAAFAKDGTLVFEPGDACRLLQPVTIRGHTRRLTDPRPRVGVWLPLLPGTNRCRVRWHLGCVAASRASEPRSARDDFRSSRSTGWTSRIAGHCAGERSSRAFFERFARAPLATLLDTRVTGPILRKVWRASRFIVPAETHLGRSPRERRPPWESQGAFVCNGTLTRPAGRTFPCAPRSVPRHAASERHCSGAQSRLFDRPLSAPL